MFNANASVNLHGIPSHFYASRERSALRLPIAWIFKILDYSNVTSAYFRAASLHCLAVCALIASWDNPKRSLREHFLGEAYSTKAAAYCLLCYFQFFEYGKINKNASQFRQTTFKRVSKLNKLLSSTSQGKKNGMNEK